ncbi:MAG: hypothetical protein ACRDDH_00015 [Cetobacterium sp.]|uniref:hypothetical protein n=1 Tax=Cetobacterium sp. TaxID=2071632 RepID=UPI003EE7F835
MSSPINIEKNYTIPNGNHGDYAIYWYTDVCRVGLTQYTLTNDMKKDIEKCLRKELPNMDFYNDFFGCIYINSCSCHNIFKKFFKNYNIYKNTNKKFIMDIQLEYTCYCSNYGTPGMTRDIDLYINWS